MKFSISWFSFVELTVSMAIRMVIIVGLSFTMTSIADNLRKWQSEINMYQDISDFFRYKKYLINQNMYINKKWETFAWVIVTIAIISIVFISIFRMIDADKAFDFTYKK